uniref:Major facilitator superfamily (MFS) profile domain-containing protein n=1 Tax=Amphimedon queenslandica TaxID=400682 RepID=A0A1X7VMN2_AMPQE
MNDVKWVKGSTETAEYPDEDKVLLLSSGERDGTEEEDGVEQTLTDNKESQPITKLTTSLATVTIFSIIGGFVFGYDTSVISGALLILDKDYDYTLTSLQKELVVSVTIGAAALGAVLGGPSNEILGRRPTIMIASFLFTIGAILMAAAPISAWGWIIILIGRFIVGIGIGLTSMTVPMYLAECSPSSYRGKITVLSNAAVTGGQFVAGLIDFGFSYVNQGWRYMLGITAVPSLMNLIAFIFLPESPRWLVGKGKKEKARLVLAKLRGGKTVDQGSIAYELQEITNNLQEAAKENNQNIFLKVWTMLRHRHLLMALIVGCGLQAIQQLSGINTVNLAVHFISCSCDDCVIQDNCFYCLFPYNATYGQEESNGFCVNREWTTNSGKCWIPDSIVLHQDNETCDSSFLTFGQFPPNDIAQYGTVHSSCPNTFSWLAMIALVMYIVSFAPGMGPVPWTVNAEIYPNWARSIGNSLSSTTNWTSNLLVSITFLHLTQYLTRYGAFSLYVCLALLGWLFIFLLLPETKGKTLEQVEGLFKGPPCPPPGLRSRKTSYNKLNAE